MCGNDTYVTKSNIQSFKHETLRWKDKYYKLPQYDACNYIIKNPQWIYKPGANVLIRFPVMQSVDIFLFGGVNSTNATKKVTGVDETN